MGMYDTVTIKCPHCGNAHREQTKSGPCCLAETSLEHAHPSMISGLHDTNGDIWCAHCNKPFKVKYVTKPVYLAVKVDKE